VPLRISQTDVHRTSGAGVAGTFPNEPLVEVEVTTAKVMSAPLSWDVGNGNEVSALAGAPARLQGHDDADSAPDKTIAHHCSRQSSSQEADPLGLPARTSTHAGE